MRPDMAKVIVERPRHNHAESYRPFRAASNRWRNDEDHARTRERMKPPGYDQVKSLNENLNPLRNFLKSRCGKPWNKVHSEISEHLRLTSAVQKHVLDHLKDFVELHAYIKDGKMCVDKYGVNSEIFRGDFYVDPHGILRQYFPPKEKKEKPPVVDVQVDGKWLAKLNGIWYELTLEREARTSHKEFKYRSYGSKPHGYEETVFDSGPRNDIVFGLERHKRWTAKGFIATAKRQLSKKELRRHGLENR